MVKSHYHHQRREELWHKIGFFLLKTRSLVVAHHAHKSSRAFSLTLAGAHARGHTYHARVGIAGARFDNAFESAFLRHTR